ncbi:pyridoxamine 5'-phosphate oxidase family protein [Pedobacter sp. MR2016-24]|uniref:pyridoxamine 5'-phosphate oxidase family protein n=1 Tax=Pedobacter sp. MR2016-24 TaxID=2994466 RepID=UPI0022451241|nr:pyridoxamine 5'-phosphate oxidase family protein [Pedobacter sp. MR2016-24]MCX2485526.1 pyridoxamine 5'-phosphate oxidase family protein [Pedobacter sp. MR2016-24]
MKTPVMKVPNKELIPSRAAKRAHFDAASIYPILDEAFYCTVSYVFENRPFSIPTAFVRYEDRIYIHGSVGSHFIREIEKGIPVCISITLMDALVIAKSAFSHNVNYRSVVIFAQAIKIESEEDKTAAFEWLTNKTVPDSWDYLRPVTKSEIRKTTVLAFELDQASAKIRTGMPNDEAEDKELPIWSGIIPLETRRLTALPDESSIHMELPAHLMDKTIDR